MTHKIKTILLVDDDSDDQLLFQEALSEADSAITFQSACNGIDALEKLNSEGYNLPDLIFMDVNMPKMNGLELLEVIRNTERWKDLKCFIITTSSEEVDRNEAKKLSVSGYIIKPLKLNMSSTMDALNLMIDLMNFKSLN